MGAHDCAARICQLWEWSLPRSWLPIEETPGCFMGMQPPHCNSLVNFALLDLILQCKGNICMGDIWEDWLALLTLQVDLKLT